MKGGNNVKRTKKAEDITKAAFLTVDWSGLWLSFHGDSRARYSLTEPILLQVEHVAVEFVLEPFRPFGPSLGTMNTFAR